MRGVQFCEQHFVRSPHFKQTRFLFESGLRKLSESVTIAGGIPSSSVYAPWSLVGTACAGQVGSDLCAWLNRVILHRRTANFTSERWYHGGNPQSETASRPGVQISHAVEEERVEFVPVASPTFGPPGPSKICFSHSKRKRKSFRSPVELPYTFEISSPPATLQRQSMVEDSSSALAAQVFRGKSRRSGSAWRAAPVFQMGFHRNSLL